MSTIHSRFATQLGKKILHEDKEYILEKVSLSHLECMNGTTDLHPFVIDECRIIFDSNADFIDSKFPREPCVIKTGDGYISALKICDMTPDEQSNIILAEICRCSGIEVRDIKRSRRTRHREYVWTRQIHMSVLNMLFKYSLAQSGYVYNLDHSTVLHSKRKVIDLLKIDWYFRETYKPAFDLVVNYFGQKAIRMFDMYHMYPENKPTTY